MVKKITLFIVGILCLTTLNLYAQDIQLSQFYNSPIYTNPAHMGNTGDGRAVLNYRNQWQGSAVDYNTIVGAFDIFIDNHMLSYGIQFKQDEINSSTFSNIHQKSLDLTASIVIKEMWGMEVSLGAQMGVAHTSSAFQDLVFGGSLVDNGMIRTEMPAIEGNDMNFLAKGGLGLSMSNKRVWFGTALHNLTIQNIQFRNVDELPVKFSVMGGYTLPIGFYDNGREDPFQTLGAVFHYQYQEGVNLLNVGANITYYPFFLGLNYRGVYGEPTHYINQHDAFIITAGVKVERFEFAWSIDQPASNELVNMAMAQEASFIYYFDFNKDYRTKKKRKKKALPCSIVRTRH